MGVIMRWDPPEDHLRRYRLCRGGFALIAVAAGVMTLDSAGHVAFLLSFHRELFEFFNGPRWVWWAGTTIAWSGLLGSCLLWGRWDEPHWRRRANLLVMLALASLGLWLLRHGVSLGLLEVEAPWPSVRNHLSFGVRLAWLWLTIGLTSDVALHLGRSEADEARTTLYGVALAAGTVWALLMLHEWNGLGRGRFRITPLYWLLFLGTAALRGLTGFFLTVLALLTARESGLLARQLQIDARHDDLFAPHEAPGRHD